MSDWKKRNDDWRDEDELEEEEECECPWVDSKGKVRETAYCQYLLEKHPMMCLKQKLFDQNGEVDEDALLYEVHSDLRDFVLDNLAKKEKQVLDALRIETYTPEWKPQLDRIHLQNGTYFLDERGFVPEKELCPSTKAQKMLVMTGKGGEGKSRIGLLLKKLFGEASHSESILRIETNRFASANLEYKLVMVDDDLNMVALPETRNIKSIVTAEDRLCIERKNKQAVQGLLYVRFICFGNGNLVAAHDDSDGFWRRQILITVKDRDPYRRAVRGASRHPAVDAGRSAPSAGEPLSVHHQRALHPEPRSSHGGQRQPDPVHAGNGVCPLQARHRGTLHLSLPRLHQVVRG
mgnify:CR=1 FL=1